MGQASRRETERQAASSDDIVPALDRDATVKLIIGEARTADIFT